MNYIIEPDDLLKVFQLVNNYLDPGGVFIFDMNTKYKYEEILGECTIAENRDTASFIWDNYYDCLLYTSGQWYGDCKRRFAKSL